MYIRSAFNYQLRANSRKFTRGESRMILRSPLTCSKQGRSFGRKRGAAFNNQKPQVSSFWVNTLRPVFQGILSGHFAEVFVENFEAVFFSTTFFTCFVVYWNEKKKKKNSLTIHDRAMYIRIRSGFLHFPLENKVASCLQDKQVSLSQRRGRFDVADPYLLKRN